MMMERERDDDGNATIMTTQQPTMEDWMVTTMTMTRQRGRKMDDNDDDNATINN